MTGRRGGWLLAAGCAAVGVLALFLRIDFLLAWRETPFFAEFFIDPATCDRWASAFAAGNDWREGGVYPRVPLYIWYLGSIYDIAGRDLFLPRLIQVVLGSVSCVLLALPGKTDEGPLQAELGKAYARSGLPAEAIREFRLGLALDPGDAQNRHRLATLLVLRGEFEEAEEESRKVVDADPLFDRARISLGNLTLRRGKVDTAIEHYRRALAIGPDDETASWNLRQALEQTGR